MKKLLLISLVIHLLLLAALAPWLVTRMEFDRAEEARRTEEVSKRELARKEQERLRRERIRLDRKTADMLRREAEKIRRKEMARELDELRKIRERIFEERERELDRFRKRRAEDVVAREKKRVQRMAAELVHHAAEARRTAEQQKESPEDAEKLLEQARKLENRLNQENALTTEREKLVAEVETFERSADEASKEETADQPVRNAFARTERSAGELRKALEALGPKTDMAAMNDTSAAGETATPPPGGTPEEAAEIYQEARDIEREVADARADISAAHQAETLNSSYAEARESLGTNTPERPDLAPALQGIDPETVGGLNEFREALGEAVSQMQDMAARGQAALGSGARDRGGESFSARMARQAAASMTGGYGTVVDMTGFGGSAGDSQAMRRDTTGEGADMQFTGGTKQLHVDQGKILDVAMPGRRFTRESVRRGWLYLDTWYVIGPWENESKVDYTVVHPPETGIDFDAVYHDGKFADEDEHPDRELRWRFYQSDQVRNQPPRVYAASTYYAHTDVWFDEERDMLIAIASDDAACVWLNDEVVWQDTGQSSWQLGEGYRRVRFRKGFNTILVRIENGPAHCIWSVVLCPPEVLGK